MRPWNRPSLFALALAAGCSDVELDYGYHDVSPICGGPLSNFGSSATSAGDVNGDGYGDIVVGAEYFDNGRKGVGRACVYHGSADGIEAHPAWMAEGEVRLGAFGNSVSTAGDVDGDGYGDVLVADSTDEPGGSHVWLYRGGEGGLSAEHAWRFAYTSHAVGAGWSGSLVTTAGDVNGDGFGDVLVDRISGESANVALFYGSSDGLAADPDWDADYDGGMAAGDVDADGFGDVVLHGASGPALHLGAADGLAADPVWSDPTADFDGHVPDRAEPAGDVDGDGYADILVGASGWSTSGEFEDQVDRVQLYRGATGGLDPAVAWEWTIPATAFETNLSAAGDVNGDGYGDIVLGAMDGGSDGDRWYGVAWLYTGGPAVLEDQPTWTGTSDQDHAGYGSVVTAVGDVNGDGYGDFAVGAPSYEGESWGEAEDSADWRSGRVYVYLGPDAQLDAALVDGG